MGEHRQKMMLSHTKNMSNSSPFPDHRVTVAFHPVTAIASL